MTRISNIVSVLTALALLATGHAVADDLDVATQKAIKSACHGNLLDDGDFEFLARYFNFHSPLCVEVRESGDDFDYTTAFERHHIRLTPEDLRRIYEPGFRSQPTAGKFELECTYNVPGGPVGVDSKCQSIRESLAEKGIDVSLSEYRATDKRCDGHHGCIDDWAEQQTRAQSRSSQVGDGPSLDDLMGDSESRGSGDMFDQAMAARAEKSDAAVGAEVGFDDIYAARETHRINAIKQTLFDKGEVIAGSCQCALSGASCFEASSLAYNELNESMSRIDANYESEMRKVCATWMSNLRGRTSDDENILNRYLGSSDAILARMSKLSRDYENASSELATREQQITARIEREQEAQRQASSGFNLGKFAGLATGTLIGAGMSDLTGADTVELLGRAALDSMSGSEGVDNFHQGMEEITDRHLEQIDALNDIQIQTDTIAEAQAQVKTSEAPSVQSTSIADYDSLLSDNNVVPESEATEGAFDHLSSTVTAEQCPTPLWAEHCAPDSGDVGKPGWRARYEQKCARQKEEYDRRYQAWLAGLSPYCRSLNTSSGDPSSGGGISK